MVSRVTKNEILASLYCSEGLMKKDTEFLSSGPVEPKFSILCDSRHRENTPCENRYIIWSESQFFVLMDKTTGAYILENKP